MRGSMTMFANCLIFPNAVNDDQVDATTLALNQLRGTLFPDAKGSVVENINSQPLPGRYYHIAWIPARQEDSYTALVFDLSDNTVVSFGKYLAEPIENQITSMYQLSRMYNGAVVRAIDDLDEALLWALEVKGVYVQRLPKDVIEDIYNLSTHYSNSERFGPDRPRPHGAAGHSSGWIPILKEDEEEFLRISRSY